MATDKDVVLGKQVVADGRLRGLRMELGLTRSAMAELLHTSPVTYVSWEVRPDVNLWPVTAGRVGRFYSLATVELDLLREQGVEVGKIMPMYLASTLLGVPQDLLLRRYREGEFEALDLGILGLWMMRSHVAKLRGHR